MALDRSPAAQVDVAVGQGRIAVAVGTRPEIIKMAPVIRRLGADAFVIDTGQHYDTSMSGQFWSELGLAQPDVRLDGGGMSRAACIGYLTAEIGRVLAEHRPAALLVQGDTNSTAAAAIAANAVGVPLVHVEAGLRSFDRAMPEEHNRVLVDHLADLCCAVTPVNAANLAAEGVPPERIVLTGNTIVEATLSQLPASQQRAAVLQSRGLLPDRYILATVHRPENTDDPEVLRDVLAALAGIAEQVPVVLPAHPRTILAVKRAACEDVLEHIEVLEPLGSAEFLTLAAHAAALVSDSGGMAEEVTVLKRPLVIVRRSTERPESIDAGFARLVTPDGITAAVERVLTDHSELLSRLAATPSPYGDGTAAARIVRATQQLTRPREVV